MRISTIRHPEYQDDSRDMEKWRLTAKGGRHFIDRYLRKFDKREDQTAFDDRRAIAYCPAFSKIALSKLKNTFYSRMSEITRRGGPQSYIDACEGKGGGVDRYGSSMSTFMGQETLFELMSMRRVGVYVDRNPFFGPTKADNKGNNPYLYYYKTEDILTWDYSFLDGEYIYKNVLLRDYDYDYDQDTGFVKGVKCRYRQVWMGRDGLVHVQYWIEDTAQNSERDIKDGDEIILNLTRIPFVFGALQESLLMDTCDYQVAMLNVASADINYVYKANFPFYTEEYDPAAESVYTRGPRIGPAIQNAQTGQITNPNLTDGTAVEGSTSAPQQQINIGAMQGRRYPKGGTPPSFIAPPTEPLIASMAKQDQMKDEIFQLIDLAASRARPQHASAESKGMDDRGLESGLSYIGLELEYMEREIAKIWAEYENSKAATISYPTKYTLKSDAERIDQAKALDEVKSSAPSKTFAKEVGKQITSVMLSDKVPIETLTKIYSEIDQAEFISSDPELIKVASELGMVDAETGSNALGFEGKKVVPIAKAEHTQRLKEISDAQSKDNPAARGVPDKAPITGKDKAAKDGNPGAGKE